MSQQPEMISWLMLERYALGELQGAERDHVERALQSDEQTRQCLAKIHEDLRVLPALPAFKPELAMVPHKASWRDWLNWPALSAVAVTAAIVLFVAMPKVKQVGIHEGPATGEKGDHVALDLVREHGGSIANDPLVFELGDRFKLSVTCPSRRSGVVDVVVHQDGEASFPIAQQAITCGNNVVLSGAFSFDRASPARVCVVLSNAARPTREISVKELSSDHAACVALNPAR